MSLSWVVRRAIDEYLRKHRGEVDPAYSTRRLANERTSATISASSLSADTATLPGADWPASQAIGTRALQAGLFSQPKFGMLRNDLTVVKTVGE